ncbi:hypothetical protein H0H81_008813 [Sphagnurus paluster]|uniref:RNA-dependent RNA polymerase n=1 Tax=Sphagnurus paluster TaxID=117069 RepID=A0A9P7G2J6_9AGAR|nr:hypothetical protein H0H81_008813 [Sphagnurus paluster]
MNQKKTVKKLLQPVRLRFNSANAGLIKVLVRTDTDPDIETEGSSDEDYHQNEDSSQGTSAADMCFVKFLTRTDTDRSSDEDYNGSGPSSQGSFASGWSMPLTNTFKSTSPGKKRLIDSRSTSRNYPLKQRCLSDHKPTTQFHKDQSLSITETLDDDILSPPAPPTLDCNNSWNAGTSPVSALDKFLAAPLGVDLAPSIIAHDAELQALMDRAELAWGVQYEIARGITRGHWSWEDVKPKVKLLEGTNQQKAGMVRSIMLGRPPKACDDSVWRELDREQAAILENRQRGLGLMGSWHGEPEWYGGQVQQLARLSPSGDTFKIHLDELEKRRSYRLARFYGSRRILQLRIPDELARKDSQKVKEFLLQKFVLCGRVFVPYFAKENTIYMVETLDDYERASMTCAGDQFRLSFKALVDWHNSLGLNVDQPIAKWSTRFALAFSSSMPVLEFKEENMLFIDDLYPSDWTGPGKPPSEKILTDGCGFINEAALKLIAYALNLPSRPTAVQGRIEGGKGLWVLHPTDRNHEPRIYTRPSQTKIAFPRPLHRSHRILDLCSVSRASGIINLSKQSIMNLAENGVPFDILKDLMVKGLMDQVQPLMQWDGPHAMENLWHVINQLGGVSTARLQRLTAELSRVLGIQRMEWGHEDIGLETEDIIEAEDLAKGSNTGRNEYSGAPLSIHELTLELIQAGFRPDRLGLLMEKIRYIIKNVITSTIEKFSIPLPESLGAFVIPDPVGILEAGQVYYRSSQPLTDPETQTLFNVVTGDVLLGRYPVRLASDIQKAKAVDVSELANYPDVLIVSTKGNISYASLLAGGDYDGDELFIIREKSLVEPFKSKPLTEMPSDLLLNNFEGHPERVTHFAERVATMETLKDVQKTFQEILLLNLNDSKVGMYSNFHDYAAWQHGYDNPKSIRLAYMFNVLLDSSKTGMRLRKGVFEQDLRLFNREIPETYTRGSRPYIFHTLNDAGQMAEKDLLREYDMLAKNMPEENGKVEADKDLLQPYDTAFAHAIRLYDSSDQLQRHILTNELQLIRDPVNKAEAAYRKMTSDLAKAQPSPFNETPKTEQQKKKKATQARKDQMRNVLQLYNQDVPNVMLFQDISTLKASYAYKLAITSASKSTKFAFDVAFRDLCNIKANAAKDGVAPCTRSFDEAKSISSKYVRALTRLQTMDL